MQRKTALLALLLIAPAVVVMVPTAAAGTVPTGTVFGAWLPFFDDAAESTDFSSWIRDAANNRTYFVYGGDTVNNCVVSVSDDDGQTWFVQHRPVGSAGDVFKGCTAALMLDGTGDLLISGASEETVSGSVGRMSSYDTGLFVGSTIQSLWASACGPNSQEEVRNGVMGTNSSTWVAHTWNPVGGPEQCVDGRVAGVGISPFDIDTDILRTGPLTQMGLQDGRYVVGVIFEAGNRLTRVVADSSAGGVSGTEFTLTLIADSGHNRGLAGVTNTSFHFVGETSTADSLCDSGEDLAHNYQTGITNLTLALDSLSVERAYLCTDGETFTNHQTVVDHFGNPHHFAESSLRGWLHGVKEGGVWAWEEISWSEVGVTDINWYARSPTNFTATGDFSGERYQFFIGAAPLPPPPGPENLLNLSQIVGFDMDPLAETIIVRHDGGDNVSTVNPTSMNLLSAAVETNCNQFGGVHTVGSHVAYVGCTAGGDPNRLFIKDRDLTSPERPEGCNDDACSEELEEDDGLELGALRDFKSLQGWRINFEKVLSGGSAFTPDRSANAIAFATSHFNGDVGPLGIMTVNNWPPFDLTDPDYVDTDYFTAFSPSGAVAAMCAWTDASGGPRDGDLYMGAAAEDGGVRTWKVVVSAGNDGLSDEGIFVDVTRVPDLGTPAGLGMSNSLACASGKILVGTSDATPEVRMVDQGTGAQLWTQSYAPRSNGLAMSADGKWAAVIDANDNEVVLLNATDGSELGRLTPPVGNYRAMAMDIVGQNLWVASDQQIVRYTIYTVTTGDPVAITAQLADDILNTETPGVGTNPISEDPPTSGPFADITSSIAESVGSQAGAELVMLALFVIGGAGAGGGLAHKNGWGMSIALSIGAAVGFALAWGLGAASTLTVTSVAIVLALLAFIAYKATGSRGA